MRRLLLSLLLVASPASAQEDKAKCRTSFEAAQSLRDEAKLTAAREETSTCIQVCPAGFAKVCEGWLGELDLAIPTIVVRAVDGKGQDLVTVTVTLDGKKIAEKIDGKPIAVDPGTHSITLRSDGKDVTKEIVVAQGEKNRTVVATFESKPSPPPVLPPSEPSAPVAAFVVGGLGVVALGGFAYFGAKGDADHKALVDGCSKTASCSQQEKDGVVRDWRIADVFLASGVVLVGVGTYLYFSHHSSPRATVGFAPANGGGRASLRVEF